MRDGDSNFLLDTQKIPSIEKSLIESCPGFHGLEVILELLGEIQKTSISELLEQGSENRRTCLPLSSGWPTDGRHGILARPRNITSPRDARKGEDFVNDFWLQISIEEIFVTDAEGWSFQLADEAFNCLAGRVPLKGADLREI
jgi:hypothetical protein